MRRRSGRSGVVVAVVSGKGGTGKSVVAVNLAVTLATAGHKVALVDADLGKGACALLLGPDRRAGAGGAEGVRLIEPPTDADADPAASLLVLDEAVSALSDRDFVLIDAPSGRGAAVRWALDRADAGLLVLADEPTAIADAYALAKRIWSADPEYPLAAVVNLVDDDQEAVNVASRFAALTDHFLGRKILYGGSVPFSAEIRQSVRLQQAAVDRSPIIRAAFSHIADRVRFGSYAPVVPLMMN